jgi:hypothetical protein
MVVAASKMERKAKLEHQNCTTESTKMKLRDEESSVGDEAVPVAFAADQIVEMEEDGGSISVLAVGPVPSSSKRQSHHHMHSTDFIYGRAIQVSSSGADFPKVGSVLGPYFCLGLLGRGTFSSVHKCINMQYFHKHSDSIQQQSQSSSSPSSTNRRVVAAKVELADFQQSGVLQAESSALDFLSRSTPTGTVPVYMGHYKSDRFAAVLMEYLPGQDMNQLREHIMNQRKPIQTRRISVRDAVYLCGEVMLPLLQRMHHCGMIHRDVVSRSCAPCRAASAIAVSFFCLVGCHCSLHCNITFIRSLTTETVECGALRQ